jgi:hypothetical protein
VRIVHSSEGYIPTIEMRGRGGGGLYIVELWTRLMREVLREWVAHDNYSTFIIFFLLITLLVICLHVPVYKKTSFVDLIIIDMVVQMEFKFDNT